MTVLLTTSAVVGVLALGTIAGFAFRKDTRGGRLTQTLAEPLNGVRTAQVELRAGTGNLTVSSLPGGEQRLASGTLQYFASQGMPHRVMEQKGGHALLQLSAGGAVRGHRFPWDACRGGEYEWAVQINPTVLSDLSAHSDGGNLKLDLTGMAITRVAADTGGGNIDLVLPEEAAITGATAKSGAGNVTVHVPANMVAKIHATSGMGKVSVDSRFGKVNTNTYQSPGYDAAAHAVTITLSSGAGNVTVIGK